jgi:hypothetical protein
MAAKKGAEMTKQEQDATSERFGLSNQPVGNDFYVMAARRWMEAAARCDLDAVISGMSDSCKRYGEPDWMVMERDFYAVSYKQFLESFTEYRLEILNVVAQGRSVVFEMVESAKFTRPYPLPNGQIIQPNGKSYVDRVCTWVEVDESGKISEIRAYIPSNRGKLFADAVTNSA